MKIYDISRPIYDGMYVYPGDPQPKLRLDKSMAAGDMYNLTLLDGCVHLGAHVDAPRHFVADGDLIGQLDLEDLVGDCRVVDVGEVDVIDRAALEPFAPKKGERLLIKTKNSDATHPQHEVQIDISGARYLIDCGVRTVGVDGQSVGTPSKPVHDAVLGAKLGVIEGLNLASVQPGEYFLAAAPVNIRDAEGAPCRAILIEGMGR